MDLAAVIAFVDEHVHKIELLGLMTRSGKSFGRTVTFHMVAKAWREGDVDRGDKSRMVVVEGLPYSIDAIAQGVELVIWCGTFSPIPCCKRVATCARCRTTSATQTLPQPWFAFTLILRGSGRWAG
jgi:hypothetical protein